MSTSADEPAASQQDPPQPESQPGPHDPLPGPLAGMDPPPSASHPGPHDSPPDPLAGLDPLPPIRGGFVGRQWPLLLVLLLGAAGLVVVGAGHFRPGCQLLGASVLCAAVARTVLAPRRVGLLVVRSRAFDVAVMLVLGLTIEILAAVIPTPRG